MEDGDLVSVCLNGLGKEYKPFKTSITIRENVPNFRDLVSMLIVEEKTLNEDSSTQNKNNVEQHTFYSNIGRGIGRGHGQGQGGGCFGNQNFGQQQSNDSQQQQSYRGGGRGQSQGRGAKEDVAIGIDNSLDQILETVIIVANQAIRPENVKRRKVT